MRSRTTSSSAAGSFTKGALRAERQGMGVGALPVQHDGCTGAPPTWTGH